VSEKTVSSFQNGSSKALPLEKIYCKLDRDFDGCLVKAKQYVGRVVTDIANSYILALFV